MAVIDVQTALASVSTYHVWFEVYVDRDVISQHLGYTFPYADGPWDYGVLLATLQQLDPGVVQRRVMMISANGMDQGWHIVARVHFIVDGTQDHCERRPVFTVVLGQSKG